MYLKALSTLLNLRVFFETFFIPFYQPIPNLISDIELLSITFY